MRNQEGKELGQTPNAVLFSTEKKTNRAPYCKGAKIRPLCMDAYWILGKQNFIFKHWQHEFISHVAFLPLNSAPHSKWYIYIYIHFFFFF